MAPFVWCGILTSIAVGVIVATRAYRSDAGYRGGAASTGQSETSSDFPQENSTEIFLDAYGSTTGAVSTSNTSTHQSAFVAPADTGYVSRVIGDHGLNGVEKTKPRESHPDIEEDSLFLANLQAQILGIHVEVDVSRRSSPKRKTCEVGKSRCA